MPICEISFAQGVLSKSEKDKIIEKLTKLLLQAEGLPDNPISRSICLIDLHESNQMYIGGKISDEGKIIIKIHSFSDAFTDSMKKSLYSQITNIFIEENKITKELKGNNIWCIIRPIQPHNFGAGGKPVSLKLIRKLVSSYK